MQGLQNKPVPYRLIFVDIDGTLIGPGDSEISARTRKALNAAREAGCHVVICTGRGPYMMEKIAAQLDFLDFAVVFDGASVWDLDKEKCLYRVELSAEISRRAAEVAIEARVAPLCYGLEDRGFEVHTVPELAMDEAWRKGNEHRMIAGDMTFRNGPVPQLISVYGPSEMVKGVAKKWREKLTGVKVLDGRHATKDCWNAYVCSASVDKSTGAAAICRLLEVDRKQTLAIGDGENDLPLLRWAGMGVCMGNGHENARACAGHITASVEEDGVAEAIERFVLGK